MTPATEQAFATLIRQGYLTPADAAARIAQAEGWHQAARRPSANPGQSTARAQALLLDDGKIEWEQAVCLVAEVRARITGRLPMDEYATASKMVVRCMDALDGMRARAHIHFSRQANASTVTSTPMK